MTDQTRLLVSVLAKTDAIFSPMRQPDWSPPAPANFWTARSRFDVDGVPWSTGKGDEASRKAAQRYLRELVTARLVVSCGCTRRRGVRLTPRADAYTRSICGFPADAHAALSRVTLLTEEREMLCSELWLIGAKTYGEVDAETLWTGGQEIMPAIVCGWVESLSDIEGRVYFRPTAEGLAAARSPAAKLPEPPGYDDEANGLYHAVRTDARFALRTDSLATPGEIGFIPLPCSLDLRRPRTRKAPT